MDQLENLKSIWQNQEVDDPKFSNAEIQKMIHQKSSSVVKWILIISILEFLLPTLFFFFSDSQGTKSFYEIYGLEDDIAIYSYIHFAIIIGFIFLFYKNYKSISVDSNVKNTLKSILKTRRTVKNYIYYNITFAAIIGIHIYAVVFNSKEFLDKLPEGASILTVWVIAIVCFAFVLLLFWGLYRLIYGFLLRKLKRNYKDLLKTE